MQTSSSGPKRDRAAGARETEQPSGCPGAVGGFLPSCGCGSWICRVRHGAGDVLD
jgi:hypothetical protein